MTIRPELNECPEWYHGYINSVPDGYVNEILEDQLYEMKKLFAPINEMGSLYRYAQDKWSIKEVLGHIIDAERILSYRTLRFARGDKTDIPQYDHDAYVTAGEFGKVPWRVLQEELEHVRNATMALVNNFTRDTWKLKGTSGGKEFTVNAMVYIMVGHVNHHINILKERYLK